MTQPVEIADICAVLEKLDKAEVLSPHASNACARGAFLLRKLRETVLCGGSDSEIVSQLKQLLANNQEG